MGGEAGVVTGTDRLILENWTKLQVGTMERYRNLGGNSGVVGYEITDGAITVQFSDDSIYLYTAQSAGLAHLKEMHRLAVAGRGLNSFISRVVRKGYSRRLR